MKKLSTLLFILATIASAQTTFQPGVTFTDGSVTALVVGPTLPCPVQFNWPWCKSLNTSQLLWFYATTEDPTVLNFKITASYALPGGSDNITVTGICSFPTNPAPGQVPNLAMGTLTLPYPATLVNATISPVEIKQTSQVSFK